MIVAKLTVTDIAGEILKVFDLDGEALAVAMEELHKRVKAQEADPEVATKMLTESFLAALRRSNEKELREFARIKFEASRSEPAALTIRERAGRPSGPHFISWKGRLRAPQEREEGGWEPREQVNHNGAMALCCSASSESGKPPCKLSCCCCYPGRSVVVLVALPQPAPADTQLRRCEGAIRSPHRSGN
jgi:hypothetical protein